MSNKSKSFKTCRQLLCWNGSTDVKELFETADRDMRENGKTCGKPP